MITIKVKYKWGGIVTRFFCVIKVPGPKPQNITKLSTTDKNHGMPAVSHVQHLIIISK